MEFTGEYVVPVSQARVWAGLNDPEILRRSIPGCEYMEQTGENEFTATVMARVGPVSARFKGKVQLEDLDPPNGYTLHGRGQGGAAGFAKGTARVGLAPDEAGTRLSYTAEAEVGGKLASVGGRLVQGVAKKTADDFFRNFSKALTGEPATLDSKAAERMSAPERASAGRERQGHVRGAEGHIPLVDRIAWLLVGVALGVAGTLVVG